MREKLKIIFLFSLLLAFSININIFISNGAIDGSYEYKEINDGKEVIITKFNGNREYIYIPNVLGGKPVTAIGEGAFANLVNTKIIEIPDTVTKIENGAFYGCESLIQIEIPSSVIYFGGNSEVETDRIFGKCKSLTSVSIGDGIRYIPQYTFSDCESLTNIDFGNSVLSLGKYTFNNCSSLKYIIFSNNIQSLGENLFNNCKNLESIIFSNNMSSIPNSIAKGCKKLSIVIIGSSIQIIGEEAFKDCENLSYIVLPPSVKIINEQAFYNCKSLETLELGKGITTINDEAFKNCTSLKSLEINDKVVTIGKSAFAGCSSLQKVYIGKSMTSLNDNIFADCVNLVDVTIGENIMMIGKNAFAGCSSLENIIIPKNVKKIDEEAFKNCKNLQSISLLDGLETIEKGAFNGCSSLKSIAFPESLKKIESDEKSQLFGNCTSLEYVIFNSNLKDIPSYMFYNCPNLSSAVFWENIESLPEKVFVNCNNLKEVYFLGKNIECKNTFVNCNNGLTLYFKENSIINSGLDYVTQVFSEEDLFKDVEFYIDNGRKELYITLKTLYGKIINMPINPKKSGYTFLGWYDEDDNKWDFTNSKIYGNIKLYAKWSYNNYKISFDTRGGNEIDSINCQYNDAIGTLPIPVREDYKFLGWYLGENGSGDKITSETIMPSYDILLYANWEIDLEKPEKIDISVSKVGNTSIKIDWSHTNKRDGYEIYYATSKKGEYNLIATVGSNVSMYIHPNLKMGKTYYYKIRAYREYNGKKIYGKYSNVKFIYLDNSINVLSTSIKTVSQISPTKSKISWNNVDDVNGYILYRSEHKNGIYKKVKTTSKTSVKDINLEKNKTYYYKIRVYKIYENIRYYSEYSTPKKIKLNNVPATPNLVLDKIVGNEIDTYWGITEGADGYEIYYKTKASDEFTLLTTFDNNSTGLFHSNRVKGTHYYKVRAFALVNNEKIYSKYSKIVKVKIS